MIISLQNQLTIIEINIKADLQINQQLNLKIKSNLMFIFQNTKYSLAIDKRILIARNERTILGITFAQYNDAGM